MLSSGTPTKFQLPFATAAGPDFIRPVPVPTQIGVNDGFASMTTGFPPLCATPVASGGVPPFIQDFNGLLLQITQWLQWYNAGGQNTYDGTFQGEVGGYPKGASVASATTFGLYYMSLVDNNVTNPDTGGAGWLAYQPLSSTGSTTSGNLYGLTTGNAIANPTTAITVQPGACQDSTNSVPLVLQAVLTKSLTSTWTAGSGNGGRSTAVGLVALQTWHIFIIYNPTTAAIDGLFDQSAANPTLPAGFTKFRRVGSIFLSDVNNTGSTAIPPYLQYGNWFMYKQAPQDYVNAINSSNSGPYLRRMRVPQGVKVNGSFYYSSNNNSAYGTPATSGISGIHDPDFGSPTSFGGWGQIFFTTSNNLAGRFQAGIFTQFTDMASQIYTQSSDPADQIAISTLGWEDPRGQFYPS